MQRPILWVIGVSLALWPGTALATDKPLRVVATVSSLGEIVERVGGEHVDVHVIVPPRLNPHYIQPKPATY
jgi:ABC-type Zn uptake system ZnuABC Zn-binding protein ZnuA